MKDPTRPIIRPSLSVIVLNIACTVEVDISFFTTFTAPDHCSLLSCIELLLSAVVPPPGKAGDTRHSEGRAYEDPSVEVSFPVRQGSFEVLLDLGDGLGGLHLVGTVDLKKHPLRFQVAIVLPVANIAPWPNPGEVLGIDLPGFVRVSRC